MLQCTDHPLRNFKLPTTKERIDTLWECPAMTGDRNFHLARLNEGGAVAHTRVRSFWTAASNARRGPNN